MLPFLFKRQSLIIAIWSSFHFLQNIQNTFKRIKKQPSIKINLPFLPIGNWILFSLSLSHGWKRSLQVHWIVSHWEYFDLLFSQSVVLFELVLSISLVFLYICWFFTDKPLFDKIEELARKNELRYGIEYHTKSHKF